MDSNSKSTIFSSYTCREIYRRICTYHRRAVLYVLYICTQFRQHVKVKPAVSAYLFYGVDYIRVKKFTDVCLYCQPIVFLHA